MISAWGVYTFIFYAGLDIVMAILVFIFVKETKGRSLEEMETIFHSKAAFDVEAVRHEGLPIPEANVSSLHIQHKDPDAKPSSGDSKSSV